MLPSHYQNDFGEWELVGQLKVDLEMVQKTGSRDA